MEFKNIEGYKYHLISNTGIVKSLPRNNKKKETLLKESDNGNGYKKVGIQENGVLKNVYIHRLVAQAFIPNPLNKKEVNHKNGIRHDNRVENLEWVTSSENNIHAIRFLGRKSAKGNPKVCKPVCKLDLEGNVLETYESTREADRANGINGVYRVCKGERYSCGGFRWKYQEKV